MDTILQYGWLIVLLLFTHYIAFECGRAAYHRLMKNQISKHKKEHDDE